MMSISEVVFRVDVLIASPRVYMFCYAHCGVAFYILGVALGCFR